MRLNTWLKAAIVTLAIVSIASRIPQVKRFVFNEGA